MLEVSLKMNVYSAIEKSTTKPLFLSIQCFFVKMKCGENYKFELADSSHSPIYFEQ